MAFIWTGRGGKIARWIHVFSIAVFAAVANAEDAKVTIGEFCSDLNLAQFGVEEQADFVQGGADQVPAVKLMQDLRGGTDHGGVSLSTIIKRQTFVSQGPTYAQGISFYAAPGIVMGICMFLWCCCTSTCRMCGRCWKPKKRIADYSRYEKCCPVWSYLFFGAVAGAFAIVGLVYVLQASNAVTGTICDLENMRIETDAFVDGIQTPLNSLSSQTDEVLTRVQNQVGATSGASAKLTDSISGFSDFSVYCNSVNIQPRVANHTCTFTDATAKTSQTIAANLDADIRPTLADIAIVETNVKRNMLDSAKPIIKAAGDASKNIAWMKKFTSADWMTLTRDASAVLGPVKNNMTYSAIAFFGFTFAAIALTLVGIFFQACGKYTNCTGVKWIDDADDKIGAWLVFLGWFLTGLVASVMFILSGVLLPMAIVMSDACVVVASIPKDMNGYLGRIITPPTDEASRRVLIDNFNEETAVWKWEPEKYRMDRELEAHTISTSPAPANWKGNKVVGPSAVDILHGCYNNRSLFDVSSLLPLARTLRLTTASSHTKRCISQRLTV